MAYNLDLAQRLRMHLSEIPNIKIEEKKMFGGLAFMVNGKMCINVSGENLMCRFDQSLEEEVSKRKGYRQVIMKDRVYKGYCYVSNEGFNAPDDFNFWINLCLSFNSKAKSSKKK